MSLYAAIARNRISGDAAQVRPHIQGLVDYFTSWTPPEGVTLVSLYGSIDLRLVISIWEADGHAGLHTVGAQFSPWQDIEFIPVNTAEDSIAALTAGGMITAR